MIRPARALLALLALGLLAARPAQPASLRDRVERLVQEAKLEKGKVGVLVFSVRDGRAVYAAHEREPFRLASNTKLLTTSAALCRLGPSFRFRTAVGTIGNDLHVFGGGDPNLSGRFHEDDPLAVFKAWTARLKEAGVTRVQNLVLHTGIFDGAQTHPEWKSYEPFWWWAAPFGALSFNDNCVDITVDKGAAAGAPCRVTLSPDTAYATIVNATRTAAKPDRPFGFSRPRGSNVITLRGDVAGKATYSVAIHDPARYFGTVLRETLARNGIEVAGGIEESAAPLEECRDFREVAAHESPLVATLGACNKPSQNFYAEMLLRTLGWKLKGKGTTENGLAVLREFAAEAGLEQVSQADGSGLTRDNLASPADLVKLLLHMRGHKDGKDFLDSLPANGMARSTLQKRMTAEDIRGRVRAKTGHIGGVSSLSGYVDSLGGDTFVFSILASTPGGTGEADRLQNQICELLARHKE